MNASPARGLRAFFQRRWFLISLTGLIAAGMGLGSALPAATAERWLGTLWPAAERVIAWLPRITTACVLFLMAFSLDSGQLQASFRSPRPVILASLVNLGFIPLAAWALAGLQSPLDFRLGLMIAAAVPCTLAAASVWTRKADGNDAVSLMVTLVTNGLCFAVTPFWLKVTTGSTVQLDVVEMMVQLLVVVLVPTLAGQVIRQFPGPGRFATRNKTPIGVVAQALILVMVFQAAYRAGVKLSSSPGGLTFAAVAFVWTSTIALHVLAMLVGIGGGKLMGFSRRDWVAVAFASSQKTLPIGVLLATDPRMFGSAELAVPFAVFPMLMYHASQLFIDTAVADRLRVVEG
ncbi:MAG: bile acid:sodium symporter [Planctomycetes bacterium]|nr:bile acid:sodium symporter [Planctomycetota bacterium]